MWDGTWAPGPGPAPLGPPPAATRPDGVNVALAAAIGVGLLVIVVLVAVTFLGHKDSPTTAASTTASSAPSGEQGSTSTIATGGGTFTDPGGAFTMALGPTWTVNHAIPTLPTWNIGSGSSFADNVNIFSSSSPTALTLDQAVQAELQGLRTVKGFDVVSTDTITLANGDPAGLITMENSMLAGGTIVHQQQIVAVNGRQIVVITVSTATADPQPVFDSVAPYVRSLDFS